MRRVLFLLIAIFSNLLLMAQQATVVSPNQKLVAELYKPAMNGSWYLKVEYNRENNPVEVIPAIRLGLSREDQEFSDNLKLLKQTKVRLIAESYHSIHGKRSECSNQASEVTFSFENDQKSRLNLVVRVYNDGLAFRYEFPDKGGCLVVKDEYTSYCIPANTQRWLEKWNTANENVYTPQHDGQLQQSWGYPALFQKTGTGCWYLIHEAALDGNYCGSKLSNVRNRDEYKITFPDATDGNGLGASCPSIQLPWKSPWRVIIVGALSTIVESTLIEDVCPPSVLQHTGWIKPGIASWNYWSNNHGTKDYQEVCRFADLAVAMHWPYTLLDWEWDAMGNGGKLEDAARYILSKGIKPLVWYNSGGKHTNVSATPRDRMLTHENRLEEFARLKKMGFVGVKIDFFESEKQDMIRYYLDILNDAATFEMMVYFHGCLVPRGWSRTYPHLMTYEGIRGAEWYNNTPDFTWQAPEHNSIVPFTRNVVGPMDYTPVTFTNSQYPHITSYGHELALSVIFESGIQHFADRPEGYLTLPDTAKQFLQQVPNSWDDIRFIDGYPGKDIILARRKADCWFLGGINSEQKEKTKEIHFSFLPEGKKYQLLLIADGHHDKAFAFSTRLVDSTSVVNVKMLRRGGFVAKLELVGSSMLKTK
ncbi:MAG: glycoside hydrolase family 97 catalytic domain-containing protein [Bacteroidota bacterium]|nr:glycoside hydrolase family 97 catalytic domain-containing protein [Bacteroidota bacterium]